MSELPALPRPAAVTPLGVLVEDAFSPDGALARAVEGYEPRVGQRDMAHAVADCVEHGGTLLAEATILSTLAGAMGVGAAIALTRALKAVATLGPTLGPLGNFTVTSDVVTAGLALSLVVGLLSGLVPALGAARGAASREETRSPAQALGGCDAGRP